MKTEIGNFFRNLVFPENLNCIICGDIISRNNVYSLCRDCFNKITPVAYSCEICGKPIERKHDLDADFYGKDMECEYCKKHRVFFDRHISCLEYGDTSKYFILPLKYSSKTYLSEIAAKIMKERLDRMNTCGEFDLERVDYILYVPLHRKRLKKRGYNQSELIAEFLSGYMDIPVLDCLERIKETKRLFNLDDVKRRKELRKAFNIKSEYSERLKGKNVLLIDDIFTTGSTLNEISKMLKRADTESVTALTLLVR